MRVAIVALLGVGIVLWCSEAVLGSEVSWTPAHELAPQVIGGSFLAHGDLDGDGDDDVTSWRDQYWNLGCPGPLSWELEQYFLPDVPGCTENSVALGDCDADGDLDVIFGCFECCSLHMVWNAGTSLEPAWQYGGAISGDPYVSYWAYYRLADLDADGDLDLVGTHDPGPGKVCWNTGTAEVPSWSLPEELAGVDFEANHAVVALGDLDGDVDLDIVFASSRSRVKCYENTGTAEAYSYVRNDGMLNGVDAPTDGAWGLALPDVDCDGDCDLVIVGWYDAVYLYLNDRFTPVESRSWGTIKALFR